MTRYLVIETAYLGDVIISLAVARAIKEQDATAYVLYLVRPDARELVEACPDVDRVITFDKRGTESGTSGLREKAAELSALEIDVIVALHQSRRTRSLIELTTAKRKVGFKGPVEDVLTGSVEDTGWRTRYERALLPLQPLFGVALHTLPRIGVVPVAPVDDFLREHARVICIAPGSAWATKQWPLIRFEELAINIARSGYAMIVIGGASEVSIGERLYDAVSQSGGHLLDLTGKASLLESAYAISRSQLLVGNDSSPVHLAVAVGTPAIAIFGPTVPGFGFAPPGDRGVVVEKPLWCRPCTSHGSMECPIHTHECMTSIGVDDVRVAVQALLAAG